MIKSIGMRKIILGVAVSLDGFIEGSKGEYDWCFTDQDYGMSSFMQRIDAIFYGRKSYEVMIKHVANSGGNPFAGKENYVFSTTLTQVDGAHLIDGDIDKKVNQIKQDAGKDIWLFGGAALTASLMNAGLVDELSLAVHPIILGSGKPLFQGIKRRIRTKLVDTKTYSTGLVSLQYRIE